MPKTKEPFKVGVLFSKSGQTQAMENSMLKATLYSIKKVNQKWWDKWSRINSDLL